MVSNQGDNLLHCLPVIRRKRLNLLHILLVPIFFILLTNIKSNQYQVKILQSRHSLTEKIQEIKRKEQKIKKKYKDVVSISGNFLKHNPIFYLQKISSIASNKIQLGLFQIDQSGLTIYGLTNSEIDLHLYKLNVSKVFNQNLNVICLSPRKEILDYNYYALYTNLQRKQGVSYRAVVNREQDKDNHCRYILYNAFLQSKLRLLGKRIEIKKLQNPVDLLRNFISYAKKGNSSARSMSYTVRENLSTIISIFNSMPVYSFILSSKQMNMDRSYLKEELYE